MTTYTEKIVSLLDPQESNIDFAGKKDVFICLYSVMTHNETQFVCYLTHVNSINYDGKIQKVATFPFVHGHKHSSKTKKYVERLLDSLTFNLYVFRGFTVFNNNNYLFYECKDLMLPQADDKDNNLYWTTQHEILNLQNVVGVPMHSSVYDFFYKQPAFIYFSNVPLTINLSISENESFLQKFQEYDNNKKMFFVKHSDTVGPEYIRALLFSDSDESILFTDSGIFYKDKTQFVVFSISQS